MFLLTNVLRRIRRLAKRSAKAMSSGLYARTERARPEPHHGRSIDCLANALQQRGINYEYRWGDQVPVPSLPHLKFLTFSVNGVTYYYSFRGSLLVADSDGSVRRTTDGAITEVLAHKNLANSILRRHGFSVPEGLAVHRDSLPDACAFFSAFLATAEEGVCVKPTNGRRGRKVYIGVRDLRAFRRAFRAVTKAFDHVLIEEVVAGTVYRFFCVAGRVTALRYGVPANVQGDGHHSIADLLDIKNLERKSNPFLKVIKLTGPGLKLLQAQGMNLTSIPAAGERVWLSQTSNLDQGADIVDATESMHPSYTALVEQAVQKFPGLILCGADVAVEDASRPATNSNYHFIELNESPGFEAHHFPSIGKPQDVAGAIVEYLISRG